MSNPKVRSLGKRGGQQPSEHESEAKKRNGSFEADEATKDIVRSLFEEYASDDGKNFYTGSKDEISEKEHEEFIDETNKNLNAEKTEDKALEKNARESAKETREPVRRKKVSVIKSSKNVPDETEAPETEDKAFAEESAPSAKKAEPKKSKGKAKKAMVKSKKTDDDELLNKYDDYDDDYEYEDDYDDYDDEYEYEDDYDDDDYDDDGKSGVEFSLKVLVLSIALVIVVLIMIALFVNNRSLSAELTKAKTDYNQLMESDNEKLKQLNEKIAQLQSGDTPENGENSTTPANNNENGEGGENNGSDNSNADTGSFKTYTIQSGDTLAKIAARELGSSNNYHLIEEANPDIDARSLHVGDEIKIPVTEDNSDLNDE